MDTVDPKTYRPSEVHPVRSDPPGAVTEMPSPREMHHVHIFSDVNYDAVAEFYR